MIKIDNLSFSFPQKDLYNKISFTLEDAQHCAFIGTSGSGKSTLVDIIMDPERYKFRGALEIEKNCRIGYVSQFSQLDKTKEISVFEFIGEKFIKLQNEIASICAEMETSPDIDPLMEKYQLALDVFDSIGGDDFESEINKKLNLINLVKQKEQMVSSLSGGEFKLVQVIKEMLDGPDVLIMDEPDVFLDFENLNALRNLINSHKGILLVVTHNRYLLNNCFNKIVHIENMELQEFDGRYIDYNFELLQTKIDLQELSFIYDEEIARNDIIVTNLRKIATYNTEASRGKALKARVRHQERLEAGRIKAPFVYIKQPEFSLYYYKENDKDNSIKNGNANAIVNNKNINKNMDRNEKENDIVNLHLNLNVNKKEHENIKVNDTGIVLGAGFCAGGDARNKIALKVRNYSVAFDESLLENISFDINSTDKVAIIGSNGTGKTTLLKDIFTNKNDSIFINPDIKMGYLSQIQGEVLNESNTVYEEFFDAGFESYDEIESYISNFGFEGEIVNQKIGSLSGGEKNMLQLAKISAAKSNMLLLDEPTSHLDTYSQIALEKAIDNYKGAILMISHDFYSIVNCMDYVIIIEDKKISKMSIQNFRKMIYASHFDKDYLEIEQNKKSVETKIEEALLNADFALARVISKELEELIKLL